MGSSSDPAALRRAAAVVRHRRNVGNTGDLQSERVQRTNGRLAAGAGPPDAPLEILHAVLQGLAPCALRGDLRGKRRGLARSLEAGSAGGGPGERIALAVGDGDDRVVERRVNVDDGFRHVLLHLLAYSSGG